MKKIHGRFLMISFFLAFLALPVSTAWAHICDKCPGDCGAAVAVLKSHHEKGEKDIIKDQPSVNMVQRMTDHKFWTVRNLFLEHFLPKLMAMSTQMTTTAMDQIRLVGLLFDAKHLLETDRVMQELQVQANKDYHPSESFCWFGTNVRSLTESETRGRFNQAALSEMQMTRQLGTFGSASAASGRDLYSRWQQFTAKYCDPKDNNWYQAGSGLETACGGGGSAKRRNIDIDYTRLVEVPRTLPVDFKDDAAVLKPEEEDILALSSNLYGHSVPVRKIDGLSSEKSGAQPFYLEMRSVLAKRAVAQESFNAIVGLKAESETEGNTAQFLAALARDSGLEENEVLEYLGDKPSTYAQLELLSQTMFQNPDFFVTLYDKPVNVKRKKAALNAVELMLDRYLYESELRQEMLLSVLLSASGTSEFDETFNDIQRQNQRQ